MRSFVVAPQNVILMEKMGVFEVAKILTKRKEEVTSFEEALLRSIHWFAHSLSQFEIENEVLSLVTSLETLLTSGDDNLLDAVGYGIAYILGSNVAERQDIMDRYKEIYRQRSKTSHHGYRAVDEIDLIELRYIASKVIDFAIKHLDRWQDHGQLLNWVKERKLS